MTWLLSQLVLFMSRTGSYKNRPRFSIGFFLDIIVLAAVKFAPQTCCHKAICAYLNDRAPHLNLNEMLVGTTLLRLVNRTAIGYDGSTYYIQPLGEAMLVRCADLNKKISLSKA